MVSILERFLINSGLQLCANSIHSSLARKKALLFHGPKIVKINKMRVRLPSARSKLFCLFIWQTQFVLLTPIFNQQWYFVIKIVLTYCEFQGDLFNKRDAKIWASTAVSGFLYEMSFKASRKGPSIKDVSSNFSFLTPPTYPCSNVPTNPIMITRFFTHWPMEQL